MISKGLKVGDTFKDGNKVFTIDAVLVDGNYISHCISVDTSKDIYNPTPAKVVDDNSETDEFGKSYTKTEINRMPKEKLEILSQELGLEIGTTAEMKTRLLAKLGL